MENKFTQKNKFKNKISIEEIKKRKAFLKNLHSGLTPFNIFSLSIPTKALGDTTPRDFLYMRFSVVNGLIQCSPQTKQEIIEDCNSNLLFSLLINDSQKEYKDDPVKYLSRIYDNFIKAKSIVFFEDKSYKEVYENAEKYGLSRKYLNNVGYLLITTQLMKLLFIKENYLDFIDWEKLNKDRDYQILKAAVFSDPSLQKLSDEEICSKLRNLIGHNKYTLSMNNEQIEIVFENQISKDQINHFSVPLSSLKQYIDYLSDNISDRLIRTFIKEQQKYKKGRISNLRATLGAQRYHTESENISQALLVHNKSIYNLDYLKINNDINDFMLLNPTLRGSELFSMVAKKEKGKLVHPYTFHSYISDKKFIAQDLINRAQLIFSQIFDKDIDYSNNDKLISILGDNADKILDGLRNSLIHGFYHVEPASNNYNDNVITFNDYTDSDYAKLKQLRKTITKLKKQKKPIEEIYAVKAECSKYDRPRKHVCSLTYSQLQEICDELVEDNIYKEYMDLIAKFNC